MICDVCHREVEEKDCTYVLHTKPGYCVCKQCIRDRVQRKLYPRFNPFRYIDDNQWDVNMRSFRRFNCGKGYVQMRGLK